MEGRWVPQAIESYLDFGLYAEYFDTFKEKGLLEEDYQLPASFYYIKRTGETLPVGGCVTYVVESDNKFIMDDQAYVYREQANNSFSYTSNKAGNYFEDNFVPKFKLEAQRSADANATALDLLKKAGAIYNGIDYTNEFNAYNYYVAYPDLQTNIGADAEKLLLHYLTVGKAEGRKGK